MSPTMTALGIDQMSPDQRISLALEIWESLGDDAPRRSLTAEWKAEILRRDAELDANPEMELTWDEVRFNIKE